MISFCDIVDTFAESPTDDVMCTLIERVQQNNPTDEELAHLTVRLAESGETLTGLGTIPTADIPSTGGPSSLSTILCPLYLRALGFVVPKLGVPGRPAGGIDVLAQIPKYKIDFTTAEVKKLLLKNGYVHFIASNTFTPLDATLFSFRKRSKRVSIPELTIASLLAKKKAASVSLIGLDVRVAPHGNFGNSFSTASRYAKRFCRVASLLGYQSLCFLSDARIPYQPFIGRGESLLAVLWIITEQADPWLRSHDDACYGMVNRLALLNHKGGRIERPSINTIYSVFKDNLEIQGSSFEQFEEYARNIEGGHNLNLTAQQNGFLHVNLESLRTLIVRMQGLTVSPETPFTDPCGVILKINSSTYVHKGDILATIRCMDDLADEMLIGVTAALPTMNEPISDLHFREVPHG